MLFVGTATACVYEKTIAEKKNKKNTLYTQIEIDVM